MKQFEQILKTLNEACTETARKADKLNCNNDLIAKVYHLGRKAGIKLAIEIIESRINDK